MTASLGVALLDGEDDLPTPLQAVHEGITAAVVLEEEQGEVGGEALAEPDVVPVALGDGVAEPLVGHLVGDEAIHAAAGYGTLAVEDRAGDLHPAADPRGLDPGELLVREGSDVLGEELEHAARGVLQGRHDGVAVLVVDPGLERDPLDDPGMMRR